MQQKRQQKRTRRQDNKIIKRTRALRPDRNSHKEHEQHPKAQPDICGRVATRHNRKPRQRGHSHNTARKPSRKPREARAGAQHLAQSRAIMVRDKAAHRDSHARQRHNHDRRRKGKIARIGGIQKPDRSKPKHQPKHRNPRPALYRINAKRHQNHEHKIIVKLRWRPCPRAQNKRRSHRANNPDRRQHRPIKPAQHHSEHRYSHKAHKRHICADQPIHQPRREHPRKKRNHPRARQNRRHMAHRVLALITMPTAHIFARRHQSTTKAESSHNPPERA